MKVIILSTLCCAILLNGCDGSQGNGEQAERITSLQNKIAALEAEAERLRDIKDIKRLQRIYGYYVDEALWDEILGLMTADASVEIGLNGVFAGRQRVSEYLFNGSKGQVGLRHGQLNDHLQLQPVITVAADGLNAKGRWRSLVMRGQFGESAEWAEGVYENEYRKEDGVWKISKIHWFETFSVPYQGGWARLKEADYPPLQSSPDIPPDRPSSFTYEFWPAVYIAPFHYPHPVTGEKFVLEAGE